MKIITFPLQYDEAFDERLTDAAKKANRTKKEFIKIAILKEIKKFTK